VDLETRKVNLSKELTGCSRGRTRAPTMVALREASRRFLLGKLGK
jgi:hypothetical protein